MKKNFVRVMLFGALTLATVTYVGCKDYDDDIDNLQTQIDANAAGLAELQAKVNAGNWVTDIKSITGGFEITFNNGNKYSIVNGKDGSVVEIGENGNWFIDGADTGKPARGEKGETGATGPVGPEGPVGPAGPAGPAGMGGCSVLRRPRSDLFRRGFDASAPVQGVYAPGEGGVPPVPFESDALRLSAQRRQPHAGDAGRAGRRYL